MPSDQEIRDYAAANNWLTPTGWLKEDEGVYKALHSAANERGDVSGAQLDRVFKLGTGTADLYAESKGWGALGVAGGGALPTAAAQSEAQATRATIAAGPQPAATSAAPAPAPAPSGAFGFDPDAFSKLPMQSPGTFTPSDTAMTSAQLQKLLAADSPYIQRARTRAAEYSNQRGLLNSSIGAGAGEAAAIDSALPIAQGDAAAHFNAQSATYDANVNLARDQNKFIRDGALAAMGHQFNMQRDAANNSFTASENAAQRDFTKDQNSMDRAQQLRVAQLQEQGADGRQAAEIAARERLAIEDSVQRGLDRSATAANNEANRAWQTWQNNVDRDFRSSESALNRNAQIASEAQSRDVTLFQTYMDARYRLEADPNLDQGAKANAIDSMSDWFYNQALPAFAKGFTSPGAWPAMPKYERPVNNNTPVNGPPGWSYLPGVGWVPSGATPGGDGSPSDADAAAAAAADAAGIGTGVGGTGTGGSGD